MRSLSAMCMLAWAAFALAAPADDRRPNIVLILADDLGYSDLGCYGGEIRTPNLDRLADVGLRYSQFYNAARCCPTRASILTGLYPHQAGVGHMGRDTGLPGYRGRLSNQCATIAEVLHEAGYRTFMSGKWHLGGKPPERPLGRGFEHAFALLSGASSYFGRWPGRPIVLDHEEYTPPAGFYYTDAISDQAAAYIKQARSTPGASPFFLYLAYTAPHAPLHAPEPAVQRWLGAYKRGWECVRRERLERMRKIGLVDPAWELPPSHPEVREWSKLDDATQALECRKMAVYAAQVEIMDEGIGRVLATLRESGAAENTLVIFLSDNGGDAEEIDESKPGTLPGEPDSSVGYGRGWAQVSNTPFRRFKREVHEGGIATPFILCRPGTLGAASRPAGQAAAWVRNVGHVIDVLPTCLDAAGVAYPVERNGVRLLPPEGRSLLKADAARAADDVLAWEHEGNRAIRRGDFKLVSLFRCEWELFDMRADRTELHNLAAARPELVRELSGLYDAWAARCGVLTPGQVPGPRPPD